MGLIMRLHPRPDRQSALERTARTSVWDRVLPRVSAWQEFQVSNQPARRLAARISRETGGDRIERCRTERRRTERRRGGQGGLLTSRHPASLAPDLALEIRHRTSCRLRFQRLRPSTEFRQFPRYHPCPFRHRFPHCRPCPFRHRFPRCRLYPCFLHCRSFHPRWNCRPSWVHRWQRNHSQVEFRQTCIPTGRGMLPTMPLLESTAFPSCALSSLADECSVAADPIPMGVTGLGVQSYNARVEIASSTGTPKAIFLRSTLASLAALIVRRESSLGATLAAITFG